MKTLHIITTLGMGGTERVLYRLIQHDIKAKTSNITHVVISLTDDGVYGERLRDLGVPVHCMGMSRGIGKLPAITPLLNFISKTLLGIVPCYRLIKKIKPDVVQTWMYHSNLLGGELARLAGVPAIVWGIRISYNNSSERLIPSWMHRYGTTRSYHTPTFIVGCGPKSSQSHIDLGYAPEPWVTIPNGIPLDTLIPKLTTRQATRKLLNIDKDTMALGLVGRFDDQKNHQGLCHTLGLLQSSWAKDKPLFHCYLVGTGCTPDNQTLKNWISTAGIQEQVTLLGERNDVPEIMNALDLNLLISHYEGFPNVLAEGMASGTPCVTTDVGDAAYIVGDTGWIVPPGDMEGFRDAILSAYQEWQESPAKWAERQAQCRQRIVDNFSIEKMVDSYHRVWQSAIDKTQK